MIVLDYLEYQAVNYRKVDGLTMDLEPTKACRL